MYALFEIFVHGCLGLGYLYDDKFSVGDIGNFCKITDIFYICQTH